VEDADVSYSGLGEVLESTLADISADAVAIGAAVGGASEVAWRGSFNGADIDDRSLFYGASVTKQMIGVLLAGAVIDGTLDASDLISKWLPELSGQTGSVQLVARCPGMFTFDLGQDLVGCLGPDERVFALVPALDEGSDLECQVAD